MRMIEAMRAPRVTGPALASIGKAEPRTARTVARTTAPKTRYKSGGEPVEFGQA